MNLAQAILLDNAIAASCAQTAERNNRTRNAFESTTGGEACNSRNGRLS